MVEGLLTGADQVGALCWQGQGADLRVLLITSRRTGRWIFPKGAVETGEPPERAAQREAAEEAGVAGRPDPTPLGTYRSFKVRGQTARWVTVRLWPVRIERLLDDWPERGLRERALLGVDEALRRLDRDDMRALLAGFAARD